MACNHNYFRSLKILAFAIWLFGSSVPLVAQEGSSPSWWNPFSGWGSSSSRTAPKSQFASSSWPAPSTNNQRSTDTTWTWPSLPKPKWKMPSWSMPKPAWPSWSSYGKATKPRKPSAWSSWNQSTKRWWRNTADFLSPYPPESSTKSPSTSGWGSYSSGSSTSQDTSSRGFFSWGESEKEKKISTPNEFFGLPQP